MIEGDVKVNNVATAGEHGLLKHRAPHDRTTESVAGDNLQSGSRLRVWDAEMSPDDEICVVA